ncbi:MAG: hypothetical protein HUU10_12695 [Bacteroidetes bacterium]|nr:hypothetical protein [Bacteroidota bacterium]
MKTLLKKVLRNLFGIEKKHQPVWLYQMGKVGSKTVELSIRKSAPGLYIEHIHLMNDLDEIEKLVRSTRTDPRKTLNQIEMGRQLRAKKERYFGPHRVISLVREPVGRNVSAFFQNMTEIVPDIFEQAEKGTLDFNELSNRFYADVATHNAPANWFQNQLQPVFGVDVYKYPFPWAQGYQIIKTRNLHLLIIRVEDLNRVFHAAVREFLGIENAIIDQSNIGETKDYADIYKKFKQRNLVTADYVNQHYSTVYANHFYSPDEIKAFRAKWIQ